MAPSAQGLSALNPSRDSKRETNRAKVRSSSTSRGTGTLNRKKETNRGTKIARQRTRTIEEADRTGGNIGIAIERTTGALNAATQAFSSIGASGGRGATARRPTGA